jgi:hypothetical protein
MTLEKRNEIINFIGWREINDTDTGNWCSSAGIARENCRIRRKESRNYIYLQDFKHKLNVTLILIEDLLTYDPYTFVSCIMANTFSCLI